jgi:hypothetical protein
LSLLFDPVLRIVIISGSTLHFIDLARRLFKACACSMLSRVEHSSTLKVMSSS